MGLPGLDAHPCPQILPEPPCFVMAKDLESQVYIPVPAPPPSHLPCATDVPPCYSCGLLTVMLLYENAPGLIWGYHYVNFPVFTYVSDRFSRF
jgi:hypothetical protein